MIDLTRRYTNPHFVNGQRFTEKEDIGMHEQQAHTKKKKKKKKKKVYNRVEYKLPAWPAHEDLHLKEDRSVEVKQEI